MAKDYQRLADELEFALTEELGRAQIKTHAIDSRVKEFDSLMEKAARKGYDDPLREAQDIVGARVVVLFRSDMPRVQSLVRELFDAFHEEDKLAEHDEAAFGYMGLHFNATLGEEFKGARYRGLGGITFEVQVRTIVMDAWAAVSHYIEYKGERSVPQELRKDFFALSGLFYVADQHFEMFFQEAEEAGKRAVTQVAEDRAGVPPGGRGARDAVPLDAETLRAHLSSRYPDRLPPSRAAASELVEEFKSAGYEDVQSVDLVLDRAEEAFREYESRRPPAYLAHLDREPEPDENARYAAVGVARLSLALVDPDTRRERKGKRITETFLDKLAAKYELSP